MLLQIVQIILAQLACVVIERKSINSLLKVLLSVVSVLASQLFSEQHASAYLRQVAQTDKAYNLSNHYQRVCAAKNRQLQH
jgi:hypothetical protein